MADEKGFSDQDLLEALRAWARERGLKPGQYQEPTLDKTSGRLFWGKIKLPPGLTMEMLRESAKKIAASKGVASTDIGAAPAGEIPYTQQEIIDVIKSWVKRNYSGWDQRAALDRLLPSKVDPFTGRPTMAFTVEGTDWSKVGAPEGMNDPRLMRSILKYRTEGIPAAAPTGGLSSAAGAAVAGEEGGPPPPGGPPPTEVTYGPPVPAGLGEGGKPPVIDWEAFVKAFPEMATVAALAKSAYETQGKGDLGAWRFPDMASALDWAMEALKAVSKKPSTTEVIETTVSRGGKEYRQYRRYNPETGKLELLEEVEVKTLAEKPTSVDWFDEVKLGGRKFFVVKRLTGVSLVTPDMESEVWQLPGEILSMTDITDPKNAWQITTREVGNKSQILRVDPLTGKVEVISETTIDPSGTKVTPTANGAMIVTTDPEGKVSVSWQVSPEGRAALDAAEKERLLQEQTLQTQANLARERMEFDKEQAREAGRQRSIAQLTDAWNSAEAFSIEWARLGGEARTKSQAALNKFMTVGPGGPKGWAELVEGLRQQKAADIYDTQVTRLEEWKATLPSPLEEQISQAIAAGAAGKGQIAPAGPGLPGTNIAGWTPNLTPQMMAGRPQPPSVSFPQLPGNIPEPTALGVQTGDIDEVMRNWLQQNPGDPWFGLVQPRVREGFFPTGFPRYEPPSELSRMGAGGGGQARRTFIR